MLETYLKNKLEEKDILLMTHIVLGYPSFEDSLRIIESMVCLLYTSPSPRDRS